MDQPASVRQFYGTIADGLPDFWPESPKLWTVKLEAIFGIYGIEDDTQKFHYMVSKLDHTHTEALKEIIEHPPESDKYATLKKELHKWSSNATRSERMTKMLKETLDNKRPSQFLRELRFLAEDDVPEDMIRCLWSSGLPKHIQMLLTTRPNLTLDGIGAVADNIYEVCPTLEAYLQGLNSSIK